MIPVKFAGYTAELGAPKGWNHDRVECGSLPVRRTSVGGYPGIQSYWKPTPEELAVLLNGGAVRLTVMSEVSMPPVILEAQPYSPPPGTPESEVEPIRPSSAAGVVPCPFGLTIFQEPKYSVNVNGRIINRATGVAIPDDEPIMIFRAHDPHARKPLRTYADSVTEQTGRELPTAFERYQAFVDFAQRHPDRMGEPT